uniref:Uncharacterized protein n=1 Tax=Mycena chlorophos TaxID=658473 RepID=A0ABQ0L401_MYCCL|nr:predicted protein [Mycena chlorophos]
MAAPTEDSEDGRVSPVVKECWERRRAASTKKTPADVHREWSVFRARILDVVPATPNAVIITPTHDVWDGPDNLWRGQKFVPITQSSEQGTSSLPQPGLETHPPPPHNPRRPPRPLPRGSSTLGTITKLVSLALIAIGSRVRLLAQRAPSSRAQEAYRRCRGPAMDVPYDARAGSEPIICRKASSEDDQAAKLRGLRVASFGVYPPRRRYPRLPRVDSCIIRAEMTRLDIDFTPRCPMLPTPSFATLPAAGSGHVSLSEEQ